MPTQPVTSREISMIEPTSWRTMFAKYLMHWNISLTCSLTSATGLLRSSTNKGTAPESMTIWVCCEDPEAILVRAHAASNFESTVISISIRIFYISCQYPCPVLTCTLEFGDRRNSTNRGTTPQAITSSIGGFFSLESSFLNREVAWSCTSTSSEYTLWIISGKISASCRCRGN